MRDVHARVGRLVSPRRGRRIGRRRSVGLVDRRLLQQPAPLFGHRVQRLDIVPGDMARRDRGGGFDECFVRTQDRDKIAVTDDLDRSPGGAADRCLVDRADRRAAARLAHNARMQHAVERHIVQEGGTAEHLVGEIGPRQVLPDHAMLARLFDRRASGRLALEIDRCGERPVILPGRLSFVEDRPVLDRQRVALMAELRRGAVEKQQAHLGAGLAQGDAAELDRLAARRIAFIRRQLGVAGLQQDTIGRYVELLGGDLAHRRQDALADLDPAGRDGDPALCVEPHPLVEPRVVAQHAGKGRGGGCAHRAAPSRRCAAAFSAARRMR